jgi:hypothetical protein
MEVTHSRKSPGPFPKLPKQKFQKIKKFKKKGTSQTASFILNFFSPALHFLRKWSTLAGWLQHMPALARPCPKTLDTHNF